MIRRKDQMRVEVREKMRGGEGAVTIAHYFDQKEFGASVRLCSRLTLPRGAGIGPHTHEKEDEIFIILKGTGAINDGKTEHIVRAGDATLTGRGETHSIRNAGEDELELIAIIVCYAERPNA